MASSVTMRAVASSAPARVAELICAAVLLVSALVDGVTTDTLAELPPLLLSVVVAPLIIVTGSELPLLLVVSVADAVAITVANALDAVVDAAVDATVVAVDDTGTVTVAGVAVVVVVLTGVVVAVAVALDDAGVLAAVLVDAGVAVPPMIGDAAVVDCVGDTATQLVFCWHWHTPGHVVSERQLPCSWHCTCRKLASIGSGPCAVREGYVTLACKRNTPRTENWLN
jgi:hypothetical protein